MAKFVVCFDRAMSEQCQIEVDAENGEDAVDIARQLVDDDDTEWETTDYCGEPQLVFCSDDSE